MEKNKKKSTKKLAVALLALLGVVSTGATYAYWQGQVSSASEQATGAIVIGEAGNLTTAVNVSNIVADEGKTLVPAGKIQNPDTQVDSVTLPFSVTWTESDDVLDGWSYGLITASTVSVTVGGAADQYNLVKVVTPAVDGIFLNGDAVEVDVVVTLNEPADKTQYLSVINKEIIVTINFAVTLEPGQ
jgi:hypothetical protein